MDMDIHSLGRDTLIEYIEPYLEQVDSVRVVSVEEIEGNEDIYSQSKVYLDREALIIRPADGYSHMNLDQFYENISNKLRGILNVEPYKNPEGSGLMMSIGLKNGQIGLIENKLSFKTPTMDNFEEFLQTVKKDLEYTNNREDFFYIIECDSESAIIEVHEDILLEMSAYNDLGDDRNMMTYMSGQGIYCNVYLNYDEPYYKFRVKPRRESRLEDIREYFIEFNRSTFKLDCPDCDKQSIVVSADGVAYCTSCGEEKSYFEGKFISLTDPITEIIDNWTEYTSTIDPEGVSDFKLENEEELLMESQGRPIYLSDYGAFTHELALYTQLGPHNLWVPFYAKTKTLRANRKDEKAYVCFNCAEKRDQDYFKLVGVWIPMKADILHGDSVYVCESCKESFEQEFQELVDNTPELDSNILSSNI